VNADGRVIDAVLKLLDRQILDPDGYMAGNVDDLELVVPAAGGPPDGTAILSGTGALGARLGGVFQRVLKGEARIDWGVVTGIDSAVRISLPREQVRSNRMEAWVRDHIIGRIPGASHNAAQ
jgi:hypothetical protein